MRQPRHSRLVALLGALALSSLAACTGAGGSDVDLEPLTADQTAVMNAVGLDTERPYAGTEMRFLVCCNSAAQFSSLIERTKKEFTPMTGIEVEWADVPYESYRSKIVAEATTGGGTYDLVSWVDAWGPSIRGTLVPLDERIDEAGIDMSDFPEAFRKAATTGAEDGEYRGIPLRGHAFLYMYREDIYKQLGLEPPQTWDDFEQQAQAIKQETDIAPTSLYYGRGAAQNLFIWISMLWSQGGDIFDEDGQPIFNSEEGVKAAERYTSWLDRGFTPPASVGWDETEARRAVAQGDAATFINWSHAYENFQNPEEAVPAVVENMGFSPLPSWGTDQGEATTYGHVWPVGILQGSQNQDAAWEYIKWLTHPSTDKAVVTDKSDPATSTVVSVHLSNLLDPEVNKANDGLSKMMAESLQNARTLPMTPVWPEVSDILDVAINKIANGADAQATLDDAAASVREIIAREADD